MKLYELTDSFNGIYNMLENDEDLNYEALEDTLQSIEGVIDDKVSGIARLIKCFEAEAEAYKGEAKRLSDKGKTAENKVKWLKNYLLQAMEATAKDKIKTNIGTVSRQKSPASVVVLDQNAIPEEYWNIPEPKPVLDKKYILSDHKDGIPVPGVEIQQKYHIRIR